MSIDPERLKVRVMAAIERGEARMKPRWHFAALTALVFALAAALFLALVSVASIAVFNLRDSGVWFAVSFGARGWFDLLRSLPFLLAGLLLLFLLILEALVRRFAFVYRKPLAASLLGVFAVVLVLGFVFGQASLHRRLAREARRGGLPYSLGMWYRPPLRPLRPDDVYRGVISEVVPGGFVFFDEGRGTSTVMVVPRTRLPDGGGFSAGEEVVIIGDQVATGTVRAFGVRVFDR